MSLEGKKEIFPGIKKSESKYEDNKYSGKTVNKAMQEQKRNMVLGNIIRTAERNRNFGMAISPEEQWILNNKDLFL